jgi:hypothetical protein
MKYDRLYNLESFDALNAGVIEQIANDSAAGVVLAQSLTVLDPKIFEKKFAELTFVNSGIEFSNVGGYGRIIESLRLSAQGDFARSNDLSDDKGVITVKGDGDYITVHEYEGTSKWSNTEVEQAAMGNVNLVSNLISTHNKLYMQKLDEIGYLGSDENKGLLNNTYYGTGVSPDTIANLDPIASYNVVAGAINTQWDTVSNTPEYRADRVIMPINVFNLLRTRILNSAAGPDSVLTALRKNFPEVEFGNTFRASGVMAVFSTHEESGVMRLPLPLVVGEIVKPGSFKYEVDSKFRVGGFDILEKDSGLLISGV